MVKAASDHTSLSGHGQFMKWLDGIGEEWLDEWVQAIRDNIQAYAGMNAEETRLPIKRHQEALRQYWDLGLRNLLYAFYRDLARKRISDKVLLADVARAVALGEDILLKRLEHSNIPSVGDYLELLRDTFREGLFILLDCYQSATEEMATEARNRIRATNAGAARAREQWGLLNQILSAMDVGIVLFDETLKVVWLNKNIPRELLRISPDLAVGRSCQEALAYDSNACGHCSVKTLINGDTPVQELVIVDSPTGSREYLKVTRPISGGNLEGQHVMEIYIDTTDFEKARRSLARTKEFVRNILNSSVSGIIATDREGRVTLFNRTAEKIFGFSEDEIIGKRISDYYGGGATEALRVMRLILVNKVVSGCAITFREKSGAYVPLKASFSLLKDEQGALLGSICFCQDMRTEEALKREVEDKNQYLLSILQASMDGLVTLDSENKIASWNRGASILFGVDAPVALGRSMEEFLPHSAIQERPSSEDPPGGVHRFEARLSKGRNGYKDLLGTRTSIKNASGGYAGASVVLKDVTEMKTLQRELAEAEYLAELGRIAARVSHEIKNPIAGLRGAMEIMQGQHNADDPRFAIFQEGLAQIRRLDVLVKDLLSFAKPYSAKIEAVPLGLVAEACLPFVEQQASEAGVTIENRLPAGLPPALADPQRLQQVIINLVTNAIQATPPGGKVSIDGFLCGEELALEIKDTGCGIPEENLRDIFNAFYSTKYTGTGLGLSIVRRIINAHGGRINVSSKVPGGTTFTVYLSFEEDGRT